MSFKKKLQQKVNDTAFSEVNNPYLKEGVKHKRIPLWAKISVPSILATGLAVGLVFAIVSVNTVGESLIKDKGNVIQQLREPEAANYYSSEKYGKDAKYKEFTAKVASFASELSEVLVRYEYTQNSNFVCSPLSIELCLGMAIRCASGNTRQQLLDLFGVDYETFNAYYKVFYSNLIRTDTNPYGDILMKTMLSNSIWFNNNYKLLDSGLDGLKDDYLTYSFSCDFNETEYVINEIGNFAYEQTNHLLRPAIQIDPLTVFVLMNTLYYKALWFDNVYFNNRPRTHLDYYFENADGSISEKELLTAYYTDYKSFKTDDYSSFFVTTERGILYFIKPNDGKKLIDVFTKENIVEATTFSNYISKDYEKKEIYHTRTFFPEFTAVNDIDLITPFTEALGVTDIFEGSCDLSNIFDYAANGFENGGVCCNVFRQNAKIDVTEDGIEGAAVTYMAYEGISAPDEEYKEIFEDFVLDKEFGYVVKYYDQTVFSGTVTNIDIN